MNTAGAADRPLSAERFDERRGIRERATFVDVAGEQLFAVVRDTVDPPKAGVVVCSSLYHDQIRAYRAEVELARTLAAAGIATVRFDYRGFGHSDGDASAATIDLMREDATTMSRMLREELGVTRLGYLGTRWGALVAAGVAESDAAAPVVLWDPVVQPRVFYREAFRARVIKELASHGEDRITTKELKAALTQGGFVDILGYMIHKRLYESVIDIDIGGAFAAGARRLLVVESSGGSALSPAVAAAAERWQQAGSQVTARPLDMTEAWWFVHGSALNAAPYVTSTAAWLEGLLGRR